MERFNAVAIEIENINVETTTLVLKEGTRFGKLMDKLRIKIPESF